MKSNIRQKRTPRRASFFVMLHSAAHAAIRENYLLASRSKDTPATWTLTHSTVSPLVFSMAW